MNYLIIIMIQAGCDMEGILTVMWEGNEDKHSQLTIFWVFQILPHLTSSYTYLAELLNWYWWVCPFFIASGLKSWRTLSVAALADIGLASFMLIPLVLPSGFWTINVSHSLFLILCNLQWTWTQIYFLNDFWQLIGSPTLKLCTLKCLFFSTLSVFNCLFPCRALACANHNLHISAKRISPLSSPKYLMSLFPSNPVWPSSGFSTMDEERMNSPGHQLWGWCWISSKQMVRCVSHSTSELDRNLLQCSLKEIMYVFNAWVTLWSVRIWKIFALYLIELEMVFIWLFFKFRAIV